MPGQKAAPLGDINRFFIAGKNIEDLLENLNWEYLSKLAIDNEEAEQLCTYKFAESSFSVSATLRPLYIAGNLEGFGLHLSWEKQRPTLKTNTNQLLDHSIGDGLFRNLIEHSYAGISLFDYSLQLFYRNPSASAITGFSDDDRTAMSVDQMVHPADLQEMRALLDELLRCPGQTRACNFRCKHAAGHYIHLNCLITNWLDEKSINAIVVNFRDITLQQEENIQLQLANRELSAYKHALDDSAIVAITDNKGSITYVNDYFCRISGYSRDELIGQDHRILNSSYHPTSYIRSIWRTIANGDTWRGELRNRAKDGSFYWVATTIIPFLNPNGKPYQYIAIRFDITAAKNADEELRRRTEQMNGLLESINDGFIALDHDLNYTYVNQRISSLVGIPSEDMIGRNIWQVFPDAVGSATYHAIENAHRERTTVINEDYYRPLGIWQENRIYPSENGLSIFISDISKRKAAEHQRSFLAEISTIFQREETVEKALSAALQTFPPRGVNHMAVWLAATETGKLKYATGDFVPPDDIGEPGGPIYQAFYTGELVCWNPTNHHVEAPKTTPTDSGGTTDLRCIPLKSGDENIGVLILAFSDVYKGSFFRTSYLSELGGHIAAELKRKQLKEELQTIFDGVVDIICTIGTDRRYKRVNRAMTVLLGYSEQEILSMRIDDIIHPDDLKESLARMARFRNGKPSTRYYENRYVCRDGNIVHLAWTVRRASEEGLLFCVAKDITKQNELTELLKEATELARIGSWEVRFPTGNIYWSPMANNVLGISPEYMPKVFEEHMCYDEKIPFDLRDSLVKLLKKRIPFDMELETAGSSGKKRWIRILGDGEFINGQCQRIFGSIQDIDARKRAEVESLERAQDLAEAGRRYSELFQISPLPMFVFDQETLNYLDVNQAAVDQYGYTKEEFLSMTIMDIRPSTEIHHTKMVIADRSRQSYRYMAGTFTHIKKDGSTFLAEITSSSTTYSGRLARLVLVLDVTERNDYLARIEEQNRKLRDISWLQSHVIRAPLSRIMGLMNLLREVEGGDELKDIVGYMELSVRELDSTVREITQHASGRNPSATE